MFLERNEDEEIAVAVTGTYLPRVRGTWEEPEEPEDVEDIAATHKGVPLELTEDEVDRAREMLLRNFNC